MPMDPGSAAAAGGMGIGMSLVYLVILVVVVVSFWKIFTKAGKPGWAAIVPIYNIIVLLEIVGRPIWWIVLFLIPCVNIVAGALVSIDLGKCFGKSTGYSIGLLFILGIIGYPMLAFGPDQYTPPAKS